MLESPSSRPTAWWCLIPAKRRSAAKGRLAAALTPLQRQQLTEAMLADVLHSALRAPGLAGVALVTADVVLAQLGAALGATVIPEHGDAGLCAALRAGAEQLEQRGATGLLVLPADIPAITADDITTVLRRHRSGDAVTLVTAAQDGGTNALALSPPQAIPFCFGPHSAARHGAEASARGLDPLLLQLPRVGLDLDSPDDLARFLALRTRTRSARLLEQFFRSEACV